MSVIKRFKKVIDELAPRWVWLVPMILAVWAAWPLFSRGFIPTHDGEYHIIRFWQFYKMLNFGYPFPRWAPDLNSGYGVPLFNFNYPFPNYIGSFFHFLGTSFVDAVKLTLAAGYLTAVAWCFIWLNKLFGYKGAIVGAVVFAFTPYWLVDLYVRGSVGEVWAISWLLLILTSLEYGWRRITTLSIALMILSHNILAMLFLPLIIGYMLLRKKFSLRSVILGLGLAAYFWIPAIVERRFVTGLNPVNYFDHFPDLFQLLIPSWGTGFSGPGIAPNEMSFQLGVASLVTLVVVFIVFPKAHVWEKRLIGGWLAVYGASFILMTEWSMSLWKWLPVLGYVQYPWRLLSITLIATALLAGFVGGKVPRSAAVALAILAISLALSYVRPVMYEPRNDNYYLSRPNFTDGTSSLGNAFSTTWTPWKSIRARERFEVGSGNATLEIFETKPLKHHLAVNSSTQARIKANILYYPGWRVSVDGVFQSIDYLADGVINFPLAKGLHEIEVRFSETPLRKASDAISVICLFWLFGSTILVKTRKES